VLYESFTHPLTILSGLPSAGFGALLTLLIFRTELKPLRIRRHHHARRSGQENGIMMVDFAVERRRPARHRSKRFTKPAWSVSAQFMMTTMAALVGTLPIALGLGAGAESRRPLGLSVVGGLIVSQLLTLYITPVYYVYIENVRLWLAGRRTSPVVVPPIGAAHAHVTSHVALREARAARNQVLRQLLQQLSHCGSCDGSTRSGAIFRQRRQNKTTLAKPRMRHVSAGSCITRSPSQNQIEIEASARRSETAVRVRVPVRSP